MSVENPHLYDCKILLYSNDNEVDEVNTYFGIREVGISNFSGRKYITLNNKPIYINSALDQSFNTYGFFTFSSDEYCKNEILRAKKLGFNGLRIHVKTEEKRKLYWADKLGLLIIQDIPCYWGESYRICKRIF